MSYLSVDMRNQSQYNEPMNNANTTKVAKPAKVTAAMRKAALKDLKVREAVVLSGTAEVMSVEEFLESIYKRR